MWHRLVSFCPLRTVTRRYHATGHEGLAARQRPEGRDELAAAASETYYSTCELR